MKNLIIYLTLLGSLSLFSCKKEIIEPIIETEEVLEDSVIDVLGKDFVLIDGNLYMENMDNGQKVVYNHFGDGKAKSGMRAGNAEFESGELELDVTTWSFRARGSMMLFILNGDSLNPYEMTEYGAGQHTIIEHRNSSNYGDITMKMGGSSKPFQGYTEDYENGIIKVHINEAYTTIDGVQFTYFNELFFQEIK
jgi:hypothetical protein